MDNAVAHAKLADARVELGRLIQQSGVRHSPHARFGPERDSKGDIRKWHTTKRRPWKLKEERRARNKRAKIARRNNYND